jgi:hypothetical protein
LSENLITGFHDEIQISSSVFFIEDENELIAVADPVKQL